MVNVIQPFHLLVIALAGWLNRHQQAVIDYLIEENRVLKEQLEGQRLRFTDGQRIRLAVKAKALGRQLLDELETLVIPDTLLAWHRKLNSFCSNYWRSARMPLRAGRVPNSSSISRCMRLKSSNRWSSRPLRFHNMVLPPVTVADPAWGVC